MPIIEEINQIGQFELTPVNTSIVNGIQTLESAQFISDKSVSFRADYILGLSEKDIFQICNKIRSLFQSLVSKNGLIMAKNNWELLNKDKSNGLIHELEHLKAVVALRPELLQDSTINILALVEGVNLFIAMNNMTPIPVVDYSIVETAVIRLAPFIPSDQDYRDIYSYARKLGGITRDDFNIISKMVTQKPKNKSKETFLNALSKIREA